MALALVTGAASVIFALCVLAQFVERRRPYQAIWTLGLACYAIGAFAEFWGGRSAWSPALYAWWYLAGAVCVAAYLGLGVVFLHTPGRMGYLVAAGIALGSLPALVTGWYGIGVVGLAAAVAVMAAQVRRPSAAAPLIAGILGAGTLAAAWLIFTAPVDTSLLPAGDAPATGAAAPEYVRAMTPLFNIPGAAALLGGAVASAWTFWRRGTRPDRVVSNVLITLGAFVDSGASGLARLGWPQAFYAGQLLGVLLIFAGFLVAVQAMGGVRLPFAPPAARLGHRAAGPHR